MNLMIKKVFILLLLQILLYNLFLLVTDLKWVKHQHFKYDNIIKSERFLYEEKGIENRTLIIGTSLSDVLDRTAFPNSFINIAFQNMSIFDGLKLINISNQKPKEIFVEMNVILYMIKEENFENLFVSSSYYPKKYLPFLRQKARPVELVSAFFFNFAPKIYYSFVKQNYDYPEEKEPKIENAFKSEQIKIRETEFSKPPTPELIEDCFNRLANEVNHLEKKGVKIKFFEMPIDYRLCNLPYPTKTRAQFYSRFPKEKYVYIQQPECSDYQTSDGIHLTEKSSNKYTTYFLNKIDSSF